MHKEVLAKSASPEIAILVMMIFLVIFAVVLFKALRKDSEKTFKQAENLPFKEGVNNE